MTGPTYNIRLETGREFGPADMDVMVQWAREGRISKGALLIPITAPGESAPSLIRVLDEPRLAAILNAPPTIGGAIITPPAGDEVSSTIIPYRNKPALIGYYLGIFGCLFAIIIPVLGFIMPIAAIILGKKGLRAVKADRRVHGTAHAYIAIIGGIIGTLLALFNLTVVVMVLLDR